MMKCKNSPFLSVTVPGQLKSEVRNSRSYSHEQHIRALRSAPVHGREAGSQCRCPPHCKHKDILINGSTCTICHIISFNTNYHDLWNHKSYDRNLYKINVVHQKDDLYK